MTAAMDRARAVIAEAVECHEFSGLVNSTTGLLMCTCDEWLSVPGGLDRDGYAVRDGGDRLALADHLADAILAALVDEMGLREYVACSAANPKRRYWLETKASDWQEGE